MNRLINPKILLVILFFAGVLFISPTHASAASRFWVGGTGNWSDATNHWATASGGAPGAGNLPTAVDDVFFNSASSGAGYTVTIDATTKLMRDLNFSAPATGNVTWAGATAMTISGAMTLYAGLIRTYTGAITFNAGSGINVITSNGIALASAITFNGAGTFQLGDTFTTSGNLTLTAGTLDVNNFNVTTNLFSSSGATTRALIMGSGTWILTGTGTVWDATISTGLTLTPNTSTIKLIDASVTGKTFAGGGLIYNNLWLTGIGTGTFTISGSNAFSDLKMDTPPHTLLFTSGTTTTVATFTVSGTVGNRMIINSTTGGSAYTLVKSGGGTITNVDYLVIGDSAASPTNTWFPGTNSLNVGNNTGWMFPAVSSGGTNGTTPLWVAVGGGTNTIAYSPDGITWFGLGTTLFSGQGLGIAWNGSRWVAVGQGINSIAYSDDGITWTGLGTGTFSSFGYGVANNGSRWVAVGAGGTNSIAYSDDGITWTGLGKSIFSSYGKSVAYNGSRWVAVGAGTNTIAYSDDGITWTGLGTGTFSVIGEGVAYNGSRWIAGGQGTNSIAYSDDGITWTGLGTGTFSVESLGVAWNGSRWVAVGHDTNIIAYSDDGITWTGLGMGTFSVTGWNIAYNGSRWVAVGQGTNSIAYSDDGITWTGLGTSVFSGRGLNIASAPAPNLYPPTDLISVTPQSSSSSGVAYCTISKNTFCRQRSMVTQIETSVTGVTTIPVIQSTFTRNLKLKMIGDDVKALQIYLNTHGFLVATTGLGSLGKETTKFGLATRKALIKFQTANKLTPDGIFGPKARAVVNGK